MRSCLVNPCKPFSSIRIAGVTVLTLLLSGWTTCTALVNFNGCPPQPQITSLSPDSIPGDSESVLLIVNGSDFIPQSQIMWNGNALRTTFMGSRQLQTTITQQTFDSFGGGSSVQITVSSQGSSGSVVGCPNGGNSATLALLIS